MPHRSAVATEWRLKKGRYAMTGSECKACRELYFPARLLCRKCRNETIERGFSGNGKIVTYTTISSPPAGFEEYAPYGVALIKLDEGPIVAGQIVNGEEMGMGKRVAPVFRRLNQDGEAGVIHYGTKFEVV